MHILPIVSGGMLIIYKGAIGLIILANMRLTSLTHDLIRNLIVIEPKWFVSLSAAA